MRTYLEKEISLFCVGKKTDKEKEDNIWKRKILVQGRRRRAEKEKEENILRKVMR